VIGGEENDAGTSQQPSALLLKTPRSARENDDASCFETLSPRASGAPQNVGDRFENVTFSPFSLVVFECVAQLELECRDAVRGIECD
jgi:hypothetical protein